MLVPVNKAKFSIRTTVITFSKIPALGVNVRVTVNMTEFTA